VYEILKTDRKILNAHRYLKNMKKDKFFINNFIIEFKNILKEIHQKMRS